MRRLQLAFHLFTHKPVEVPSGVTSHHIRRWCGWFTDLIFLARFVRVVDVLYPDENRNDYATSGLLVTTVMSHLDSDACAIFLGRANIQNRSRRSTSCGTVLPAREYVLLCRRREGLRDAMNAISCHLPCRTVGKCDPHGAGSVALVAGYM